MSRYRLQKNACGKWDVIADLPGEKHIAVRHHSTWKEAVYTLTLWSVINPPTVFMLVLLERSIRTVALEIVTERMAA